MLKLADFVMKLVDTNYLVSTYSSPEDTPRKLSFNFDDIDHVETCARYFFFIKPFIRTVQITLWNSLTLQHQIYVRENSQHTVGFG